MQRCSDRRIVSIKPGDLFAIKGFGWPLCYIVHSDGKLLADAIDPITGYAGWNHQPTINTPGPLSGHTADYHFLSVIAITPEVYSPASNRWTMMNTSIQMQNYPAMHLLPSGNLFFATRWNADESPSPMLDMHTGQWGYTPWVSHFPLGTSVEYAPGKILKVAGNTSSGGTAIDSSAYIEFGPNDSTTGWVACSSAPGQRVLSRNQHNLTMLPNGQVLVTGGEGVNNDPALARIKVGARVPYDVA